MEGGEAGPGEDADNTSMLSLKPTEFHVSFLSRVRFSFAVALLNQVVRMMLSVLAYSRNSNDW